MNKLHWWLQHQQARAQVHRKINQRCRESWRAYGDKLEFDCRIIWDIISLNASPLLLAILKSLFNNVSIEVLLSNDISYRFPPQLECYKAQFSHHFSIHYISIVYLSDSEREERKIQMINNN